VSKESVQMIMVRERWKAGSEQGKQVLMVLVEVDSRKSVMWRPWA
jgi:hypothetical protein